MRINNIEDLIKCVQNIKIDNFELDWKTPEEVKAHASGYINCKNKVIEILFKVKDRMERANEPTKVLIEDCDFSVRTHNCLERAGMKTLGDIKSVEQLQNVRNLGKRCVGEVIDKLREYGIELPESEGQNESN